MSEGSKEIETLDSQLGRFFLVTIKSFWMNESYCIKVFIIEGAGLTLRYVQQEALTRYWKPTKAPLLLQLFCFSYRCLW